ncbi:peptidoglycan-binding domain-containing protein [Xinfangfangia pollutisoli]|uniref:peptidoglycan-binding domain-containing protein n=1 Tax=Xinfangfangia pollutisoli TaxID=2865960 RepID=UPI001CD564DB|nr:peptidoglycan-binding domain-containing protein [Xinfangfangia pollutisoli]
MRKFTHPILLATGLATGIAFAPPLRAETDLGDVISGVAQSLIQQELDKNAYIAAREANTISAYRDYLAKYPKGLYRANAEQAIIRLGGTADGSPTAAQTEASLGLTLSQKIGVQRALTRLGYNTYGADGVWGRNTRSALATWQRDSGLTATGYMTAPQLKTLLKDGEGGISPNDPAGGGAMSAAETEAQLRLSRSERIQIQSQLTQLGYNAGVADGLWGSRTRAAIGAWQKANKETQTGYVTGAQVTLMAKQAGKVAAPQPEAGSDAALEESLLGLTRSEKIALQRGLTRLGYNTYGADGVWGRNTRTAISAWQRDEGQTVTGYLTADQVRQIRVDTGI